MSLPVTPGSGAVVASDLISGEHHQQLKMEYGAAGTATPVSASNPLPTREPVKGSALGKGGITASTATQPLAATNASRNVIEISNGGTSGVWLAFGARAVVGQGTYLPAKATGYWPTTAAVNAILEPAAPRPVGYTEW